MRRVVLSFVFLIAVYSSFSQRIYFIYLQTESQQPFFVKMDEKLYSSTASGYLILSKLRDSVYNFTVGFPGNHLGEQKFNCLINHKDHGYLIKNYGEKGWGLLDLQTSVVQMSLNADNKKGTAASNAPVNAFTELLAKAADDSTLKQKIVMAEEKKAETAAKVADKKMDSVLTTTINKVADVPKQVTDSVKKEAVATKKTVQQQAPDVSTKTPEPVKAAVDSVRKQDVASTKKNQSAQPPVTEKVVDEIAKNADIKVKQDTSVGLNTSDQGSFAKTKVIRKSESSTTEGFGVTYIDVQPDGKQDTIKIIIPNNETKIQPATSETRTKDTVVKKNDESQGNTTITAEVKPVFKNSCRQIASDADFYKLRKKMAGGKSDNAMLDEAGKLFKIKCFTTNQIKSLGTLFLGDGGRYNFFDVAYPHVSDAENFPSLQSELKDEYFINRFKAMLR